MPQTTQRPGPRIHRLPRRLDYTLVPAPLNLSLDTMTEKSPLPAIIVTPCSPTHSKDFAIAFLAPPKRPSIKSRVSSYFSGISEAVATTKWPGLSFWSQSPIALPISAPAATTEFTFGPRAHAKRNSRISMVILTVFFLVFCHMVAHFFAYASTSKAAMTSASFQDSNTFTSSSPNSSGATDNAYSYLNKLELDRWLGWVSKATPGSDAVGETLSAGTR